MAINLTELRRKAGDLVKRVGSSARVKVNARDLCAILDAVGAGIDLSETPAPIPAPGPSSEESDLEAAPETVATDNLEVHASGYSDWSKAELQAACEARGLQKYGNKDELVARLQDDDDAEDESADIE